MKANRHRHARLGVVDRDGCGDRVETCWRQMALTHRVPQACGVLVRWVEQFLPGPPGWSDVRRRPTNGGNSVIHVLAGGSLLGGLLDLGDGAVGCQEQA